MYPGRDRTLKTGFAKMSRAWSPLKIWRCESLADASPEEWQSEELLFFWNVRCLGEESTGDYEEEHETTITTRQCDTKLYKSRSILNKQKYKYYATGLWDSFMMDFNDSSNFPAFLHDVSSNYLAPQCSTWRHFGVAQASQKVYMRQTSHCPHSKPALESRIVYHKII